MSGLSLIMMPAVWLRLPITPGEFKVLATICQFARLGSDDGCLRSYEAIGETAGLERDTVKKAVKRLKSLGVLDVELRGGTDGERRSTNRLVPNWKLSVGELPPEIQAMLDDAGAGGRTSLGGQSLGEGGGRTSPHKLYEGSSTSPPPAREGLEEYFADPDERAAYLGYRRAHRMPNHFDALIRRANISPSGGPAYDWPIIGAALLDMAGNGKPFSKPFFYGCCRRIATGASEPAAGAAGPTTPRTSARWLWEACKESGILTAPSSEAIDESIAQLVAAGRVTDPAVFRRTIDAVKPWELANARTADWAIDRIAERLLAAAVAA